MEPLLLVTGMSGAGKSQAAHALEDMGYYCVDNLPPLLIPTFWETARHNSGADNRVAVITDVRGGALFEDINGVLEQLRAVGVDYRILFLDASDDVLIRRYKENRRRHPLCESGNLSLKEAVAQERQKLYSLRVIADHLVDTSFVSAAQLKERLSSLFFGNVNSGFSVQCCSFGFKYGPAMEADLIIDVRCLPNPYYDEELRYKTGLDEAVRAYVFSTPESLRYWEKMLDFIEESLPLYCKEGKAQLNIAFGCTGGKHRSVTFAYLLGEFLREKGYRYTVVHRDIDK